MPDRHGPAQTWLPAAGLVTLATLAVASAASRVASGGPDPDADVLQGVVQPVTTAIAVAALLIVGLSARSRIAHAIALFVLAYMAVTFVQGLAITSIVDPFSVASVIVAGATLVILAHDWRFYWRTSQAAPGRWLLATVDWNQVVMYAALTIVGVGLLNWVVYNATFGRVSPDGPSNLTIAVAGVAVLAIAAGALVLQLRRLTGAMLTLGGLCVALVTFGADVRPGDDLTTQLFKLGMAAVALAGVVLLARSARD